MELAPNSALAYANLGSVLLQKQPYALAEQVLRTAADKAPQDANTLNNLGMAVEKQGRIEEARSWFAEALERNPI